jgi:hypothetical protein
MQFIDQSLPKVLPDCRHSSSDSDILSVGGMASAFKCDVNPFGDEMKGRASLHHEGRAWMVGEHENRHVIDRILSPPSSPFFIGPRAAHWPEHIPAEDPSTHVIEATSGEILVNSRLSIILAEVPFLKRASRNSPSMKGSSADSKRVLQALIWACAKTVNRNGEAFYTEFSHLVFLSIAVFLFCGICVFGD